MSESGNGNYVTKDFDAQYSCHSVNKSGSHSLNASGVGCTSILQSEKRSIVKRRFDVNNLTDSAHLWVAWLPMKQQTFGFGEVSNADEMAACTSAS